METMSLATQLPRHLTDEEVDAFRRDGATVIRGVVPMEWIERMREAIDRVLARPGDASIEYTPKGNSGRYYGDFFIWRRDPDFRDFMTHSPMPQLAAELMRVNEVNFFYDQLLVKEPQTAEPTPWHQDLPYWPLRGNDIASIWVPFDKADVKSGVVHYLAGSHKWGRMFAPQTFGASKGFAELYAKMGLEPCPDIDGERDKYTILHWDMEPGDVLVHHPLTLHYAPGNSSQSGRRRGLALRYVGPDCVWDNRPGTFMHNEKLKVTLPEITLENGERLSGEVFPRVWPRA